MNSSKTILITGTSSGFGRLAVLPLLERGHAVICGMRGGTERLKTLFGKELKTYPKQLFALDLHMEKPETFSLALDFLTQRFSGRLDVLVNNAGYGLLGAVEDQTPEQIRHQFEVNVFGPVLLTRILLPALRAAHGRVINLSSVAGIMTFPYYATYCSTKYAIEAFSEGLYYELKPHGVQVALIEPGGFKTDFSTRSIHWASGSKHPDSPYRARTDAFKNMLEKSSRRLANPERVSRLIVRLCEKKKIPLRTAIGADAYFFKFIKMLLPQNIMRALIDFGWKKVAFGE